MLGGEATRTQAKRLSYTITTAVVVDIQDVGVDYLLLVII
jgi:hypothetical protein